jgi:hypothetical protein
MSTEPAKLTPEERALLAGVPDGSYITKESFR